MSSNYKACKNFADEVLAGASSEEAFRSAIGRYYYSCYHAALSVATLLPSFQDSTGGYHKQLSNKLIGVTVTPDLNINREIKVEMNRIGYILRDLKVHRTNADYNLQSDLKATDAAFVQARTEALFTACDSLDQAVGETKELA